MILDNASWHKTLRLNWRILEPIYLPAYWPDLNPIEELWLAIKREFFSWFWTNKEEILDEQVEMALKYYIDRPDLVKSICSMSNYD
ncbi:MAG: transposase [bacterium]|nr:transposase [bacterium]